jgi:hypothetical protein
MKRIFFVPVLSILAAAGAFAGPVAINLATAGNGGASILNKNLAGNGYIPCILGTNINGAVCTTSNTSTVAPPSGLPTSFSNVLFNSAQVPFDIASGGANAGSGVGNTNNIWAPGNAAGDQVKTIDVGNYTTNISGTQTSVNASGLFGVDQIWTMLNDVYATPGTQGITLTLNGYDATGTNAISETVNLFNGVDYRSIGSTNVPQDHTACDVANIGVGTLGTNCTGHTSSTAQASGTDSTIVTSNFSGVNVKVYNSVFETGDTLTPTDTYWLDVQDINLGSAFTNGWLNKITVTSHDGTGGVSEKAILSAITVDTLTSAVPEPGTILLTLAGLGGLAFFQIKRTRKA